LPTLREKADVLRALHQRGEPLVLVNAWDAVSARIVEELGFPAIATTSAGIAWLEGFPDGERITRECMLEGVRRIARVIDVPLTADLESGYGRSVDDAIATAHGALEAGAVGLNFEDWDPHGGALFDLDVQMSRITAIRHVGNETGVPFVINARTDVFLNDVGKDDTWRLEEATRRGNRYLDAGADCVFVPGVADERTIALLANAIAGPINVLAGAHSPSVARLGELGVARVSVGSSAMAYVLAEFRAIAKSVKETGTFGFAAERITHAELNRLFSR
jgi:2-methylisocitrate lyase-like PEP mutase family enzyme